MDVRAPYVRARKYDKPHLQQNHVRHAAGARMDPVQQCTWVYIGCTFDERGVCANWRYLQHATHMSAACTFQAKPSRPAQRKVVGVVQGGRVCNSCTQPSSPAWCTYRLSTTQPRTHFNITSSPHRSLIAQASPSLPLCCWEAGSARPQGRPLGLGGAWEGALHPHRLQGEARLHRHSDDESLRHQC